MRAVLLAVVVASCSAAATREAARPPNAPPAAATAKTPLQQIEASRDLDGIIVGSGAGAPTVVVVLASWCHACRVELGVLDSLRADHPRVRWLGVNYTFHEEYADRGSPEAIRALAEATPWLRIVPADDALFDAVGAPSKIPTVIVYDSRGALAARYNRHERKPPTREELDALLRTLQRRAASSARSLLRHHSSGLVAK